MSNRIKVTQIRKALQGVVVQTLLDRGVWNCFDRIMSLMSFKNMLEMAHVTKHLKRTADVAFKSLKVSI